MPQIFPLNWMLITILMMIMLILIMNMTYFMKLFNLFKTFNSNNKIKMKHLTFKW
uniref:ATP synthase F0 subunit 8 n=1 Tax=Haemaphysalis doenitzi TaxID=1048531 RepID=UPI001FAFE6E3|nr:ATP synthase F0 subunit 8 [Haemaphysalis doenitzi]UNO53809.1 ATP synthase F0 subunit 8 [Haemaphysalis doenitzi]UNO53848.1 ATP synthase F0 subunit 8 [Haemaphysalis doenitzi]WCD42284.1 ATP synthase F0 subunit 8 [Haemaphysalis doenitzi]